MLLFSMFLVMDMVFFLGFFIPSLRMDYDFVRG